MDSNIFKSNAHRYLETRKDDVCRENSLKEGLSLFALYIKLIRLHMIAIRVHRVRHHFST